MTATHIPETLVEGDYVALRYHAINKSDAPKTNAHGHITDATPKSVHIDTEDGRHFRVDRNVETVIVVEAADGSPLNRTIGYEAELTSLAPEDEPDELLKPIPCAPNEGNYVTDDASLDHMAVLNAIIYQTDLRRGFTPAEVAEGLGISIHTAAFALMALKREGWTRQTTPDRPPGVANYSLTRAPPTADPSEVAE